MSYQRYRKYGIVEQHLFPKRMRVFLYPQIDPVAFQIGSIAIYWYGLLYVIGLLLGTLDLRYRNQRYHLNWSAQELEKLVFVIAVGILLGGKVGYVLFYQPHTLIADPLYLFNLRTPGRSFHGGLLGVACALWYFARQHNRNFWSVTDVVVPAVPLGLFVGRIGNFINGELYGRVTDVPWGMIFPHVDMLVRHPSQLYEAVLEGLFLWGYLRCYTPQKQTPGFLTAHFLIAYGSLRYLVEIWREPTLSTSWGTMGQFLSLPMLMLGIGLLWRRHR